MDGEGTAEAVIDLPADRETGLRVGRVVLFGPTGSGKTLMACALARQMAPPSFEEVYVLSPVATAANNLPNAKWFQISPQDKKKTEAFMAEVKDKRALVLIDEADAYFGGSARTFGTPSMADAVLFGRNACLSMILIAHGTSLSPKSLIENAAGVFFFRTTTPGLLDWAEDYAAEDIPDVAHTLRNLPNHVALIYAPMSANRFVGFGKLDLATGQISIWTPDIRTDDDEEQGQISEGVLPEESRQDSPADAGVLNPTPGTNQGGKP